MISLLKVEHVHDKLNSDLGTIVVKSYNNNDENKVNLVQDLNNFNFPWPESRLSFEERKLGLEKITVSNYFFLLEKESRFNIGTIILTIHDGFIQFETFRFVLNHHHLHQNQHHHFH